MKRVCTEKAAVECAQRRPLCTEKAAVKIVCKEKGPQRRLLCIEKARLYSSPP